MTSDRPATDDPEVEARGLTLLSVEFEGWAATGPGTIALSLSDRRTVLVGRNGAGKSGLMEGILLGLDDCIQGPRTGPRRFRAVLRDEEGKRLIYEHSWEPRPDLDGTPLAMIAESNARNQKWAESCWYEGQESRPIWQMKDGQATIGDESIAVADDSSVPSTVFTKGIDSFRDSQHADQMLDAFWFYVFCVLSKRVHAGIPHAAEPMDAPQARVDRVMFIKDTPKAGSTETPKWEILGKIPRRFAKVFSTIFRWKETDEPTYQEFLSLGMQVGAFRKFDIAVSDLGADLPSIAHVLIDGVNAGLAPDGTLRLIEILYATLAVRSRSIVLLEEPETGIHPGALVSLLNVLDSYAADRQFLISSHSPVLIREVQPEDLRIVYREDGQTHVRSLNPSEMERVIAFLVRDGTLDEFLLSGGVDEA